MPDCQMCWNDWPSLNLTPFKSIPEHVQVCRNCARSMKQVIAFTRHHGLDLITGEIQSGPQAGSETLAPESKREEEPLSPQEKKPARKA